MMRSSVHCGEVTFLSTCLGGELLLTGCNDGVLRVFHVEQKEKPKRDEVSVELLLRGVLFEEEEDVTCEDECVDAVTVSDVCPVVLDDEQSCGILSASSSSSRIAVTTSSRLLVYSITSPFHLALLSSFSSHEAAVTGLCFLVLLSLSLHSRYPISFPFPKTPHSTSSHKTLPFSTPSLFLPPSPVSLPLLSSSPFILAGRRAARRGQRLFDIHAAS